MAVRIDCCRGVHAEPDEFKIRFLSAIALATSPKLSRITPAEITIARRSSQI
jgi:hypothetical protein